MFQFFNTALAYNIVTLHKNGSINVSSFAVQKMCLNLPIRASGLDYGCVSGGVSNA